MSGRRRHTPTTEGGGSGVVVRLKRNLHCFKRGFYGEFIPDSSVRSEGGSGRGCEKPRSDRIQNELQTRPSACYRGFLFATGSAPACSSRLRHGCRRHILTTRTLQNLAIAIHRKSQTRRVAVAAKSSSSPRWRAEAHPMAVFVRRVCGGAADTHAEDFASGTACVPAAHTLRAAEP